MVSFQQNGNVDFSTRQACNFNLESTDCSDVILPAVSPLPARVALVWVHTFHLSSQGDEGGEQSSLPLFYLPSSPLLHLPCLAEYHYRSRILNALGCSMEYPRGDMKVLRRGRPTPPPVDRLVCTWIHTHTRTLFRLQHSQSPSEKEKVDKRLGAR